MTIIDRPLQRCSRSEMEKVNMKTEDFSDCFNEIHIGSEYCNLPDLDLNAEHFTEMRDFNDININQLLPKSEPTETVLSPRRSNLKNNSHATYESAIPDLGNDVLNAGYPRLSGSHNTSKVLGETNQILSGGSTYWDFLNKPGTPTLSYNDVPPPVKYSPVQYATCYPATTVNGTNQSEPSTWSSRKLSSPDSLLPAFSNFSCNSSSMDQSGYTPSGLCNEADYSFSPNMQHQMAMERLQPSIPEPPAYSYQSLSSPPTIQSADSRLMAPTEQTWSSSQMPPLRPGHYQGYSDSNYSSPTGSMSELHTAGCSPISSVASKTSPSNAISLNTTASCSMVSHPNYLSQSFPGASQVPHPPINRTGRSASGSAGTGSSCPVAFVPQPISCQSSPLSHGSPAAPTTCHGSWSDIPMSYQSYMTNGGAASIASDLDIDNIYISEEQRTSPVGESLPGDILLPDDGMLSPSRSNLIGDRRLSRTGIRRMRSRSGSHSPKSMELWQFLWVLLNEQNGGGAVVWLDKARGVFKVVNQVKLCELWSDAKRRNPERTKVTRYSNLTRTLRYYYQRGLMKKGERDHVYQFIAGKIDNWVQARARSATH